MQKKVGIVIVTHNASEAVRVTISSLKFAKNTTQFEVLIVENKSDSKERKSIKKSVLRHKPDLHIKYIETDENLGFSGGNNVGIKEFLKDQAITHICLLNSDVIVTDYWLDRLLERSCPAISTVTNKADSEQCVPVDYNIQLSDCLNTKEETIYLHAFETVNSFAQNWNSAWKYNTVKSDATFFCILIEKNVIETVGLLDETFYPGGYEDDDYCIRLKSFGFEIFLARDVFIHHFGSASFVQLSSTYFSEQSQKNKNYLEKKHNFKVKRRPEKPLDSFSQDILFLISKSECTDLQKKYTSLYIENLSKLIAHYDNEFAAMHSHLIHSGYPAPVTLNTNLIPVLEYGSLLGKWNNLTNEIIGIIQQNPISQVVSSDFEVKLSTLSKAVHEKAETILEMYSFLCSVNVFTTSKAEPLHQKNILQKVLAIFAKGIPFFLKLKGIVFFGGYPYPAREKDGYFQRIKTIDELFTDRWRIYIDHMPVEGKNSWYDRPAPNVIVFHVMNHRYHWFMKLITTLAALKCRTIYFHSVLRMHDSKFGKFMKFPFVKKVIDIHGVVPEEFRYHNDFFSAGIYDDHEKKAISHADAIIVVTNAMKRYFLQKYPLTINSSKIITLPILPEIEKGNSTKDLPKEKPVVVYAGGTHKWQQIDKMFLAIAARRNDAIYKIFCPDISAMQKLLPPELKEIPNITLESKPYNELLKIYDRCHYGFILRENVIVNTVACPTKLIEYLAKGIVPIVDYEEIGDFKEAGMKFISLKDFTNGNLPTKEVYQEMITANYEVYLRLKDINVEGKKLLCTMLDVNYPNSVTTEIPLFQKSRQENDSQISEHKLSTPESSIKLKLNAKITPCDILVQVDNFLVGGLENVVLDMNQTLRKSGFKITLLVLGEQGAAVEKANNMNMPIIYLPYNSYTYKIILQQANPKLIISHYSLHGASICGDLNIPLIQVIHNTYMWFSPKEAADFSSSAKHTTYFVAVSDFVREYSLDKLGVPKEKCLVIPNGIDYTAFKNIDRELERKKIRNKLGLSNDDFVFLSVGSVTHQKNHICTIRAFHTLLQYCSNAKLVILGKIYEKKLWEEIETYISTNNLSNQIIYAGESSNPPHYYAMADAFVHSGQLSILEAIASNLPVITTEIGFAKHFKDMQGIYLSPPAVNIKNYTGYIWELTSTKECERGITLNMLKAYSDRLRPDLPMEIRDLFDKEHTYRHYVDLVENIIDGKTNHLNSSSQFWTELIETKKTFEVCPASI
jgi:GT2 family glycosyltransferase/glycosyltransferase involved in cell wall biosynthesis